MEVKHSVQIHLQQQNLFQAQLEALEKQMQNLVHKVQTPVNDTDSAKVRLSFLLRFRIVRFFKWNSLTYLVLQELLQELSALLPSLVEIKETSQDVVLNNQERLQELCRRWRDSMTQASHLYRFGIFLVCRSIDHWFPTPRTANQHGTEQQTKKNHYLQYFCFIYNLQ